MKNEAELLGTVAFVQIQLEPLKKGSSNGRVYDPQSLLRVAALELTGRGAVGCSAAGERHLDAHHADHPDSRYRGANGLSIGFSAHYESMRRRFGPHLVDGIAGENIIIASQAAPALSDLTGIMRFENPDGSTIDSVCLKAMAPCDEFSHYAQRAVERLPPEELKAALRFLDNGRRGFTIRLVGAERGVVYPSARVFLLPN